MFVLNLCNRWLLGANCALSTRVYHETLEGMPGMHKNILNQAWWLTSELYRQKQEDHKFEVSLGYMGRPCLKQRSHLENSRTDQPLLLLSFLFFVHEYICMYMKERDWDLSVFIYKKIISWEDQRWCQMPWSWSYWWLWAPWQGLGNWSTVLCRSSKHS